MRMRGSGEDQENRDERQGRKVRICKQEKKKVKKNEGRRQRERRQ